ncbi:molybdopterin-guanine dinucleotide biosyn, partial [Cellulomonas hominis]|nr:molybdopterin-guanine dinucleotide biosyn [Cellulomonas hominis]
MSEMAQWLARVAEELDLPDEVADGVTGPVLDLVRDVAHGVSRPSGPLTAYLVGVAAGA